MRVRPSLAALAAVGAFALVVLPGAAPAAGPAQARYEPRFESAPCPTTPRLPVPVPALQNARCGFLVVPENRGRLEGRTIRLAVAIIPAIAQQPAPDPLVHLTGGPGGVAILEAQELVDAGFNRDRDLILMDQRGTFLSEPALTCEVIDRFNRQQVGLPLDARSTRRKHVAATRKCRRDLVARGIDIAAYNTTENAADFADLRRALGYDRWNVFGVSYGTDLALTILRDHPEGLRSVILDSTVPPSVVALSEFWPNARDGFQNIFRACKAQARCRRSFPNLERTFTKLVRRLESDPVRTTVADPATGQPTPVVLDGGALANWLVTMSFYTPSFKDVPSWIAQLAAGDPQSIATLRLAQVTPPGFVGYGLTYGVICSEWVPFDSEREVLAQGRDVLPRYPRSVLAQPPQFTYNFDDCRVWDVPAAPASVREPTVSEIPTLILSGSFDSVTPLAWAYAAAETLPNSRIASIPGVGHFVAPESPCAQSVIASFLLRPDAPDTNCVATLIPPAFATP
jgi:pimeloyl-ACP methyl ester carboxylesterase